MFRRDVLKLFGISLITPTLLFSNKRKIENIIIDTNVDLDPCFAFGNLSHFPKLETLKVNIYITYDDDSTEQYIANNKKWVTRYNKKIDDVFLTKFPYIFEAELINNNLYILVDKTTILIIEDLQKV